jgi:hypothetical protein
MHEGVLENGVVHPQIINLDRSDQHRATASLQRNSSRSFLVRMLFRHQNRSGILAEEKNVLNRPEQNTEFVVVQSVV